MFFGKPRVVAAAVALILPKTKPAAKGQPMSIVDAFGLRAFSMFKDKNVAVCILVSCAWMFAFVIYWLYFAKFLSEGMKVEDITLTMSIGQVSEMAFLVALPFASHTIVIMFSLLIKSNIISHSYFLFFPLYNITHFVRIFNSFCVNFFMKPLF